MGLRLDWIAVRGNDETALLNQFDLAPYGHVSEELSTQFALGRLANGWIILTAKQTEIAEDGVIASLARSYEDVLAARVSETVMYCRVQAYTGGTKSWDVTYDCDKIADGLLVEGAPPSELEKILERCGAEQALDSEAAYFFDAPTDLAKTVCGYEAIQRDDVEWRRLVKVSDRAKFPGDEPRSMPEAIRTELLPLLESLGWEVGPARLMAGPDQITRRVGPLTQSIWFWYVSGQETAIDVHFWELDTVLRSKADYIVGQARLAPDRRPFWKRLLGLDRPAPIPSADPIATAIAGAREDILRVDSYLRTRADDDRILASKRTGPRG